MNKTVLTILVFIGTAVLYLLALVIVTIIATCMFVKGDYDDIDYAMTANIIQFSVILVVIAEKVWQWMA